MDDKTNMNARVNSESGRHVMVCDNKSTSVAKRHKRRRNSDRAGTVCGAAVGTGTGTGTAMITNKRRRTDAFIAPKYFPLGGSCKDPLNLNELISAGSNAFLSNNSPNASPLPGVNTVVDIMVPKDMSDPLGLNSDVRTSCLPPEMIKKSKNSSNKKAKKSVNKHLLITPPQTAVTSPGVSETPIVKLPWKPDVKSHRLCTPVRPGKPDEIVSPVIPKVRGNKRGTRNVSTVSPEKSKPEGGVPRSGGTNMTLPKFRKENSRFQFGNYERYYGYRNANNKDPRLAAFYKEMFEGKVVLDIGCNVGNVTVEVAKCYGPLRVTGVDIDAWLIGEARRRLAEVVVKGREGQEAEKQGAVGESGVGLREGAVVEGEMGAREGARVVKDGDSESGSISSNQPAAGTSADYPTPQTAPVPNPFPNNILFRRENFVPTLSVRDIPNSFSPEYDTILLLSTTKWIHLNWGDDGIKRTFYKIFGLLRPGGMFILEPQPWESYKKKRNLTPTTYSNYNSIQLKPSSFCDFLLKDVGFSTASLLSNSNEHHSKGFRRSLWAFTKVS